MRDTAALAGRNGSPLGDVTGPGSRGLPGEVKLSATS
jgi:hypothetical protein